MRALIGDDGGSYTPTSALSISAGPVRLLDIGVVDVHRDGAGGHYTPIDGPTLEQLTRSLDDRAVTMPFVSQAQRQWMHINHPEIAKRWEKHTPKGAHLPWRVQSKDSVPSPGDVALIVVDDGNGRVLTVSRDGNPANIAIPGGHVEADEHPAVAASRELYEETGVSTWVSGSNMVEELFSAGRPDAHGEDYVYRAVSHDALSIPSFTPEPGEHVRWALPSELLCDTCTFRDWTRQHFDALFGHLQKVPMTDPKKPVTVSVHVQPMLDGKPITMAELETRFGDLGTGARKGLPDTAFASPGDRKYPIHDAAHVRNAAARLEQQKGSMSPAKYRQIRSRIARAAKRFGIKSAYNAPKKTAEKPTVPSNQRISVHADIAPGGRVHVVHHMSDKDGREWNAYRIRALGTEDAAGFHLQLADADRPKKLVWIQLAECGAFRGHPAGAFALTPTVFSEIVRNFDADGIPVPIDYEHASEQEPTAGNIPRHGAPAQGWIHKLENRGDDGLWGLVEWGPQAADQIRTGQYRYISPAIRFGAKDRQSGHEIGAKLTSAGLTNQPFLKGMQVLAAKDRGASHTMQTTTESDADSSVPMQTMADSDAPLGAFGAFGAFVDEADMAAFAAFRAARMAAFAAKPPPPTKPSEYMPRIKAALRLADLATCAETMAQFCRLRDRFMAVSAEYSTTAEYKSADGVDLGGYVGALADIAAKDRLSATLHEVLEIVHHMICVAMEKHELEMHIDQLAEEDAMEAAEERLMQDLAKDSTLAAAFGEQKPQTPAQGETNPQGDTTMDIKLADHEKAIAAKDGVIQSKDTEIEGLKLQLSSKDGKITELAAKLTEAEQREQDRLAKDLDAEADAMIANPDNHLKAESKPTVLRLLKADPEGTRSLYKAAAVPAAGGALPPKFHHLSQRLPASRPGGSKDEADGKLPDILVMGDGCEIESKLLAETREQTTDRLMSEKKLSFEDASQEAWDAHNRLSQYTRQSHAR
jgi:8-oxo-dGTP pyrophosphatase MutT (NUDIX family)